MRIMIIVIVIVIEKNNRTFSNDKNNDLLIMKIMSSCENKEVSKSRFRIRGEKTSHRR